MGSDDCVDGLQSECIRTTQDRAGIVWVRDRVEHDDQVIGAAANDVGDALQALFGDHWRKRLDDQARGLLQRRRPFDLDHVWVICTHLSRGLLRVDGHADDQRAALVRLAGHEEWISGGCHDLKQGKIVCLVGPVDRRFYFVAPVRHHAE